MQSSLRQDQKGLSKLVPVVIVVIIVVLGGLLLMHKSGPSKVLTSAAAKQTYDKCLKVYDDENLCAFATTSKNFFSQAYTAVDTENSDNVISKFTISHDGKGNTAVSGNSSGLSYGTVSIGTTNYVKQGKTWLKYTNQASSNVPTGSIQPDFSDATTKVSNRIGYKNLGKAKCGSLTCFKYQLTDPGSPNTTTYLWFDTGDYLLRQWYNKTGKTSNNFVISYSAVTVKAPSPVTDMSKPVDTNVPAAVQATLQSIQQQAQQKAAQ